MRASDLYEIELACRDVLRDAEGLLSFDWDERHMTAVSRVTGEHRRRVLRVLRRRFQGSWTARSIRRAPPGARRLADAFGGMQPGQYLFLSDPGRETVLFGAWWPWKQGADTASLHLGAVTDSPDAADHSELARLLRSWFGI